MSGKKMGKGSAGMSSELQAIMQRRLAKIDPPVDVNANANAGKTHDHVDDANATGVRVQEALASPFSSPARKSPARLTPERTSRFGVKPSKIVNTNENDAKSEFERNIAMFSKNKTAKKSSAIASVRKVKTPEPVMKSPTATIDAQSPHSDPKKSAFQPYLRNKDFTVFGRKSPPSIPTIPRKSPTNAAAGTETEAAVVGSKSPLRNSPREMGTNIRKTPTAGSPSRNTTSKFFGSPDRGISIIDTQPPPPPPPGPPPASSPRRKHRDTDMDMMIKTSPSPSQIKSPVKQQQKQHAPSNMHSLPSSHVQAMKLKFLLKNPKPTTPNNDVSSAPAASSSSSTRSRTTTPTNLDQTTISKRLPSPAVEKKAITSPASDNSDLDEGGDRDTPIHSNEVVANVYADANQSENVKVKEADLTVDKNEDLASQDGDHNEDEDMEEDNSSVEDQSDDDHDSLIDENSPIDGLNKNDKAMEAGENEPLFNAFPESSGVPTSNGEHYESAQGENHHMSTEFSTSFENQVLDVTNQVSTEVQSQSDEPPDLFAEWNAAPSFAVPLQDAVATGTNDSSMENPAGGWKWNNDPFSDENDIVKNASNSAQINAGGSDEIIISDGEENEIDAYEPPSSFRFGSDDVFVPKEEYFEDDSDVETLMNGDVVNDMNEVVIKSYDMPIAASTQNNSTSLSCQNSLTKNVILCRKLGKKWFIDEIDTSERGELVHSIGISCIDLKRELDSSLTITPCGVTDVLGIAAGIHYQNGRPRVRVAAIIKLLALGAMQPVNVLAIWQWGYGNIIPIALQTVIPGPICNGPHNYDPRSLSVSNGLFFVSGSVASRPAILICKPHHQIEWVPSFVDTLEIGSEVVNMEVCSDAMLLALTVKGGYSSVWSFADQTSSNPKIQFAKQQMKLLCILSTISSLEDISSTVFEHKGGENESNEDEEKDIADDQVGLVDKDCQSLSWMPTNDSSLLILAASFANVVAVYNITLPHGKMSLPSGLPNNSSIVPNITDKFDVVQIAPIGGVKVKSKDRFDFVKSSVQWIYSGDNIFPFLATCLESSSQLHIHVGSLNVPTFACKISQKLLSFTTISGATFSKRVGSSCTFYGTDDICSLLVHCNGHLTSYHLSSRLSSQICSKILLDSMNVASGALGLTSEGFPIDSFRDVLHIHTTMTLGGREHDNNSSSKVAKDFPVVRYWLLQSTMGDKNDASKLREPTSEWQHEDFPKGGATTSIIRDLSTSTYSTSILTPRKIVRDKSGDYCIVLFNSMGTHASILSLDDTTTFCVINMSINGAEANEITLYHASDVAFLPTSNEDINLLALDVSRKELRRCSLKSLDNDLKSTDNSIKIFKDGSANAKNLTVRQLFLVSEEILLLCSRNFDGKMCVFNGGTLTALELGGERALVRKKTSKLWLEKGEGFISCVELACHVEGMSYVAIATTSRVMIVSFVPSLHVLSETRATLACKNLCPLGSSVAFVDIAEDKTHNVCYLCPSKGDQGSRICNLPRTHKVRNCELLGLRPDRAVYLSMRYNFKNPSTDDESVLISLLGPVTKPALLLEPMVSNALAEHIEDDEKEKLLHIVLERFGPKLKHDPHGEKEGLGTIGAGVTAKVYAMLGSRLNFYLRKGAKNKNIAPWVPNVMKETVELSNESAARNFSFDETKHVWYRGPFDNNEELLLLDSIDEWAGKHRPTIIGKMGAELAAETGERTLHNILAAAAKSSNNNQDEMIEFKDEDDDLNSLKSSKWVPEIGEGRNDEDNLSLYLRFFEGTEMNDKWKEDGLQDITKHRNKVQLKDYDAFELENTTSNVDEGEEGKIRPLCDLVFKHDCGVDEKCGMMISIPRGSALDVGIFHSEHNYFRQRGTLEFWCYIPKVSAEIVLARRSVCKVGDESDYACVNNKDGMLWEIVALPSGRLQFRTGHGSEITSFYDAQEDLNATLEMEPGAEQADKGLLSLPAMNEYGGWNHISLTFSCRDKDSMGCNIILRIKGNEVGSSDVILGLPALEKDELSDYDRIDAALENSTLFFGLGAVEGLRFTEVRFWSCKRSTEDIKMMMYEYLDAAKTKRKLSLQIRAKGFSKESKVNGLLMPPPIIEKPKPTVDRLLLKMPGSARNLKADENVNDDQYFADFASIDSASVGSASIASKDDYDDDDENNPYIKEYMDRNEAFEETENNEHIIEFAPSDELKLVDVLPATTISIKESTLISEEVRKSAAAAIIRGPPAARHFNGNRGGLRLDDVYCKNVGKICITGSEKSIILSPDESEPSKSYPIGASGAIMSDYIDGTEYLCCFLARDKRIVVFDLQSKIVVVELQMTTKLNYWRFLPPVSHGDTLVFLLITPIGGFHWMPLEESPRPRQIWRRGRDLQGKKIVSYEEGGSNGRLHSESRSTLALVLTSSMNGPNDSIEAWVLSVGGGLKPLCLSTDILGAALFNDDSSTIRAFDPYVVALSWGDIEGGKVALDIFRLTIDQDLETILIDETVAHEDIVYVPEEGINVPTMAMGTAPSAFCLCCKKFIVIIFRDDGYLVAYRFENGQLVFANETRLNRYVVDAAIKMQDEASGADVVILLCDNANVKDGRIVTISIN